MGRIAIKNNIFYFCEEGGERVLLDCNDFLSNRSRVPLHSLQGSVTIPGILLDLIRQQEEYLMEYLLVDVLMVPYLMRSPLPVKVLEIGCMNGMMSYHIATLLGKFHRESKLCCVCDAIGNESGNDWVDRVAAVEEPPKLSLFVTDYDDIQLRDNHFDIVVINGFAYFDKPFDMIKEAKRLLKGGGMMLHYSHCHTLLQDSLRFEFPGSEEYILDSQSSVIMVQDKENVRLQRENGHWTEIAGECMAKAEQALENGMEKEESRALVGELDRRIDDAIAGGEPELKLRLIRKKEQLLDRLFEASQ